MLRSRRCGPAAGRHTQWVIFGRWLVGVGLAPLLLIAAGNLSAAELRTWTDDSGIFTVEAEFVELSGSQVVLRKRDGEVARVPLTRLSKEDIAYVRSMRTTSPKPPARPAVTGPTSRQEVLTAMAQPCPFEFAHTPLSDVLEFLGKKQGLNFYLDVRSLEDVGIGFDVPINAVRRTGALGLNLAEVLKELDLTWTVLDNVVIVTTKEEAESHLMVCVYKILTPVNFDQLVNDITSNVAPQTWCDVGGPASIVAMSSGVVLIAQTLEPHALIQRHYQKILRPVELPPRKTASPAPGRRPTPEQALDGSTTCEFAGTSLTDATAFLAELHGVEVTIDWRALEDVGIGTDTPMSLKLANVRLETALTLLLKRLDLTWVVTPDAIRITTPAEAEANLKLVAYPIGDLVGRAGGAELVEAIETVVKPHSWDSVGGPASVRVGVRGTLDVRQTDPIHREIQRLLATIRLAR